MPGSVSCWRGRLGHACIAVSLTLIACQQQAPRPTTEAALAALREQVGNARHEAGPLTSPVAELRHEGDRIRPVLTETPHGTQRAADLTLPADGSGLVEVADAKSGLSIQFGLQGATQSAAEEHDGFIVYPAAYQGGDVVHRPHVEGTEDFVTIASRPWNAQVVYNVVLGPKVAGLRLVSNVLEFVSHEGNPLLRVASPYLVGADSARADATLSVEGCAVDTNPAAPWGRTPVSPGATSCAVRISWARDAVLYPANLDPNWATTGSMAAARAHHGLVTLNTTPAQALAMGGFNAAGTVLGTAELYSIAQGTWAATGSMAGTRADFSVNLMAGTTVLVAGGQSPSGTALATTELYTPSAGTWASAGTMTAARFQHTATLLSNGHVLVVGGWPSATGNSLATAEMYNGNNWTATGSLNQRRAEHQTLALSGSSAMTCGGATSTLQAITSCETFNGATWATNFQMNMNSARAFFGAVVLDDNQTIVAVGGVAATGTPNTTEETYNGFIWQQATALTTGVGGLTLTLLSGSQYVAAGGYTGTAYVTQSADGSQSGFTALGNLATARGFHAATAIGNTSVLVSGGATTGATATNTAEIMTVAAVTCTNATSNTCLNGECVNGYCCNTTCNDGCDACDLAGEQGTCSPVAQGTTCHNPYACDGTDLTCPTSCTSDNECATGNYCNLAMGQCQGAQGAGNACGTDTRACNNGFCVDGYCCNNACTDGCDSCNQAGHLGNCQSLPAGSASASASCGGYLCEGNDNCPTSCATDAQCAAGYYCGSGQCLAAQTQGSPCTGGDGRQCASSICSSSVCCNATCSDGCDSCNVAGHAGSCTAEATGTPCGAGGLVCNGTLFTCPNSCTADSQCITGDYCTAGGTCAQAQVKGSPCTNGDGLQCASGFCTNGYCCNAACTDGCDSCNQVGEVGTCTANGAGTTCTTGAYLCTTADACPTTCAADANCASGFYCNAQNKCVAAQAQGATCTSADPRQCSNGLCVNGYCCNATCADGCDACNLAGHTGTCTPDTNTTSCGTAGFLCNGSSTTCPTMCTQDSQCVTGDFCNSSGLCQAAQIQGSTCTASDARQCASAECVNGYCCNATCADGCDACNLSGEHGVCSPVTAGTTCGVGYLCTGADACPTTCAADANCATGYYCNSAGKCAAAQTQGATCTGGDALQCSSGLCVDGYCCNATCNDGCDSCSLAGHLGTCTAEAVNTACGTYLCTGVDACPTSCSSDANCSTGNYCNANGQCVAAQAQGATCTNNDTRQCSTGLCVDGYCCNGTCADGCDSCALPGKLGVCSPIASGTICDTAYVCNGTDACPTACSSDNNCSAGNYCNAVGKCVASQAQGATCTNSDVHQCSSGICTEGYCCNATCADGCDACNLSGHLGTCSPVMAGTSCGSDLVCNGGLACPGNCTSDASCQTGTYCNGSGQCVTAQLNGGTCTNNDARQCSSGLCVSGVCCNATCTDGCDSCSIPGSVGTCAADPAGTAGSGCGAYVCDGTDATCPLSCSGDSACAAGDYCSGGSCAPRQTQGVTCSSADQCTSGFCVDGLCCNTACTGACDVCSTALGGHTNGTCGPATSYSPAACAPYICTGATDACPTSCSADTQCETGFFCSAGGTCQKAQTLGATCSETRQCSSGNCVGGVCCSSSCGTACESCTVAGSIGTCTADPAGNTGSPACAPFVCDGNHSSCPTTCTADAQCVSGDYCSSGQCVTREAQAGTCTTGDQCASGFCVDGFCCSTACNAGSCDVCSAALGSPANGTCGFGTGYTGSPSCGAYICSGTAASCPVSCTSDASCAAGYWCNPSGQCVLPQINGATCTETRQCTSGNCADGVCCNNACNGSCDFCAAAHGASTNGTCTDVAGSPGNPGCAPYVCSATSAACPTSCTSDTQCASDAYCQNGVCVGPEANGGVCTEGRQCESGNCVDGFCCNTSCTGSCAVCSTALGASQNGTCTNSSAYAGSPSCAPYTCQGAAATCPTSCTADSQCVTGDWCNTSGQCVAGLTKASQCTRNAQCGTGFCVDGVCCGSSCGGACDYCAAAMGATSDGTCTIVSGAPGSPSCAPFVCSATTASCPTTCTKDNQCAAGAFCQGGTCVSSGANGATCTEARQCGSGLCVDGVCCNNSCANACDVCSAAQGAAVNGICSTAPAGAVGSPACAPYLCNGASTTCAATCASDSDCASTAYCSNGTCVLKATLGAACQASDQCESSFCADGVCCNSACSGSCDICNQVGDVGQCKPTAAGQPGNPSCGAYACDGTDTTCPSSCTTNAQCGAGYACMSGVCQITAGVGTPCTTGAGCASGYCSGGVCCNTACNDGCDVCTVAQGATQNGACTLVAAGVAGPNQDCGAYACNGTALTCPTTCAQDTDCAAGNFCSNGQCTAQLPVATACTGSDQCASGFCADGFCCNSSCTDQCAACDVPGSVGTCSATPAGPPATGRAACATDGSSCGGACDGTDTTACAYPQSTATCSTPSCMAGTSFAASTCNGAGTCETATGVSCSPYECGSAGCLTQCTENTDCVDGSFCSSGACAAVLPTGSPCQTDGACVSGFCATGVCCSTECGGSCQTCAETSSPGTCLVMSAGTAPTGAACASMVCDGMSGGCPETCASNTDCATGFACQSGNCVPTAPMGQTCSASTDCATGNCVDGVCCNTACSGSCQTCVAPGSVGTCSLVTGVTAPGRTACTNSGTVCGGSCTGSADCTYPTATTSCAPAFCSEGSAAPAAMCDGTGTCPAQVQTQCLLGCAGDTCAPPTALAQQPNCSSAPVGWLGLVLALLLVRRRSRREERA